MTALAGMAQEKINENERLLVDLYPSHGLSITKFFFECQPEHNDTWIHPILKQGHTIDYVIVTGGRLGGRSTNVRRDGSFVGHLENFKLEISHELGLR